LAASFTSTQPLALRGFQQPLAPAVPLRARSWWRWVAGSRLAPGGGPCRPPRCRPRRSCAETLRPDVRHRDVRRTYTRRVASELPDAAKHADRDRAQAGHRHSPVSPPTPPLSSPWGEGSHARASGPRRPTGTQSLLGETANTTKSQAGVGAKRSAVVTWRSTSTGTKLRTRASVKARTLSATIPVRGHRRRERPT